MRTYSSNNPYADCNHRLFHHIHHYSSWTAKDFSNVIELLRALPPPDTEWKKERLRLSRLGETLPNLARNIGTTLSTSTAAGMRIPEAEGRLTTLWDASRPLASCFELRGYMAFLRIALEINAAAPLVKEICDTARAHGIDSTTEYVEKLLALKVKSLIANRDKDNLESLFGRAEAVGIHFRTFNWGMFAEAAGRVQDSNILEIIWVSSGASHSTFEVITWVQFSNAAGLVHQGESLGKIWDEWIVLGDPSSLSVWSSFANATARRHDAVSLEKIWRASEPYRNELDSSVWGAFAKAAGDIGLEDLLWEIWTACQQTSVRLNSNALGAFANAAGEVAQGGLLEAIWRDLQQSGTLLEPPGWGAFAKATQGVRRPDLLREIFDAWHPQPDTLMKGEHAIWGSFFSAAFGLEDEALGLEIFRRLSAEVDPVRLRNWGTLTSPLLRYAAQLRTREVAAEITETLNGLRLDTAHCFSILATNEPGRELTGVGDKPFAGAGRCLMRWLVNSYFYSSSTEFDERLSSLVDGVLGLKQNQNYAWHALVCRGQEAYAGCLRAIYFNQYKQYFSYIKDIPDEELTAEIVQGRIDELLGKFRQVVINQMATPQGMLSLKPDAPALRLRPLIDLLVTNQEERLKERKLGDKDAFFKQAVELIEAGGTEAFVKSDWLDFLRLLLQNMSERVWAVLTKDSRGRLHELYNEFRARFPTALANESSSKEEKDRLVQAARVLLLDYGRLVGGYRFGELKPINIVPAVWPRLLGGRYKHPMTINEIPRPNFTIAAWDGARDDLLMPLLKELRFNAEKNLKTLHEDEQVYRVMLKKGEGKEADYGILSVSNAYREGNLSAGGTGQGMGLIQRLADSLGGFALHSKDAGDNGLMMWTWRIYLPLFKDAKG